MPSLASWFKLSVCQCAACHIWILATYGVVRYGTYVRCRTCMTYNIVRAAHDIVLYIVRVIYRIYTYDIVRATSYVRTMSYVYIRHRV
jgi:hypothetical protein